MLVQKDSMRTCQKALSCLRQVTSLSKVKQGAKGALAVAAMCFFSGCDQTTYDRGFQAGEKSGYSHGYTEGYSDGETAGKAAGYIAGTSTFVARTFIPNLGLILSIVLLGTATSWLSINYIAPRHRARTAEYDAQHTIEQTREQLQKNTDVAVRSEIGRLQANLVLEKHEHLIRGKLEEFYANATLLLLNESMNVVDQLCDLHLKTVSDIACANDLSNEEQTLLFPAVTKQLSTVSTRITPNA